MPRNPKEKPLEVKVVEVKETILVVTVGGQAMLQNRMPQWVKDILKGITQPGDVKNYKDKPKQWKETLHIDQRAGHIGFPAEAFLKAMGTVIKAVELGGIAKKVIKHPKDLYRNLHIESDGFDQDNNGIVVFTRGKAEMSEHFAVLKGKTPIPVYRALVRDWEAELRVVYNSAVLSEKDVLLLTSRAGSGVGVGAFRPENRGPYGTFRLIRARFEERAIGVAA